MPEVIVYSTQICPYCERAKSLLKAKGVEYTEINISEHEHLREEMMHKSGGRRTVPQIFIDNMHIGGFDDLYALDLEGKLDEMLGQ